MRGQSHKEEEGAGVSMGAADSVNWVEMRKGSMASSGKDSSPRVLKQRALVKS